ncbi:hypothetical protein [Flavobacterium hydatis]|uniref:Lipoprotein n=1 Tax=Flavobacterium hydatis TaxID=991 RepID=A0A085ZTX7_FLAHY|nr:hypothetical protein [Flavobacterium hydatis]KFF07891.1 hypothetical protein IW20_23955 [Flavobacterium hydatis]OXA94204.1 hypothetical protein B0A62_11135 [Flavobacterium hydatis]
MKLYTHLLYFLLLALISCNENRSSNAEESIEKLTNKFPELKINEKKFGSKFELIKSINIVKSNFEIQLYSEPDSIENKQQIIVLIYSKKEYASIPFFNNRYKDYWEFPFDKPLKNVQKINSTFRTELNNALRIFPDPKNPRKDRFLKHEVVNEMLRSLLVCKNLEEKDSLLIYKRICPNSDIPNEISDSAFVRLRKNYEKMRREWHPENFIINYNCYFDEKNGRIYQLNYDEKNKIYKVKSYRQDWGFTPLSL